MEGPLANISAERAVDYVRESVSIKVFPPPNAVRTLVRPENRAQLVKELIRHALRKKVPVFFLRRNLADSFASRQLAKIRSDWRQPTKAQRGGDDPSPEISLAGAKYRAYLRGMNRYFEEMESIVGDIPTIWYEDIVGKEWFFVPQVMNGQGCWVRDCNNQPSKS